MTAWRVDLDHEAAKALRRLSRTDRARILAAIARLPDQGDIRELVGSGGLYRLRVGTWRVIFRADRDAGVVQAVTVSSRGSAYKP